ncbi:MAG: iron(III) transport system ATP-binding protein [Cyclobacteriaceae bacterium]|jgi:iron(III) transport system ATP-binding protein
MKALSLENINKSYGRTQVLKNFDLEVIGGEITALTGESGSGKSTILRLIAGLEELNSGSIKLADQSIDQISPRKRKIGFVFQDLALFPHLTVKKNILFGFHDTNKEERLSELLQLTDLAGLEKRYPHEISGGQQQRVALARALASSPELLLMDEPFSSLDERIKSKVRTEILAIIKRLGITTIIVTHHPADAFAIADKIAILSEGKLLQYDSPSNIYKHPKNKYVSELFGSGILIPATSHEKLVSTSFGQFEINQTTLSNNFTIFIRPESVRIMKDLSGDINGKIIQKSFNGPHDLLSIQDEKKECSFKFETERTHLKVGDNISLKLDKNKIIVFND